MIRYLILLLVPFLCFSCAHTIDRIDGWEFEDDYYYSFTDDIRLSSKLVSYANTLCLDSLETVMNQLLSTQEIPKQKIRFLGFHRNRLQFHYEGNFPGTKNDLIRSIKDEVRNLLCDKNKVTMYGG